MGLEGFFGRQNEVIWGYKANRFAGGQPEQTYCKEELAGRDGVFFHGEAGWGGGGGDYCLTV